MNPDFKKHLKECKYVPWARGHNIDCSLIFVAPLFPHHLRPHCNSYLIPHLVSLQSQTYSWLRSRCVACFMEGVSVVGCGGEVCGGAAEGVGYCRGLSADIFMYCRGMFWSATTKRDISRPSHQGSGRKECLSLNSMQLQVQPRRTHTVTIPPLPSWACKSSSSETKGICWVQV